MLGVAETWTLGCGKGYGEEQEIKRRHQKETDDGNSRYTLVGY